MKTTPSVLALIPARAGSKGIPHKNIRLLSGKPLLHFSCACALASQHVTRTIVSSDCPQIAEIARRAGAETPFRIPQQGRDEGSVGPRRSRKGVEPIAD